MVMSASFLRVAHAKGVHIGDSIDDGVAGVRAADIAAMVITPDAALALAAGHTVLSRDRLRPSHGDA
jgi:hypothetical protein